MTDFTHDPIILGHMRTCLSFMATLKGVELEQRLEDYDMKTMLDMMTEMEDMPIKRSLKARLIHFREDAIIFVLVTLLRAMRVVVWLVGMVLGGEIKQRCENFLIETKEIIKDSSRKEG